MQETSAEKMNQPQWGLLLAPILLVGALAFGYLFPLLNPPSNSDRYLALSEAEYALSNAPEDAWKPISFPLHWRHLFSDTTLVWYRFQLDDSELRELIADEDMLGVYIWRLNQTADVFVNGARIGSGGTEDVRHWNSPLYFPFSDELIQEGKNEILICHFAGHGWGSMQNVVIGADSVLRPRFESRYFIQHDVAMGLFVFVVLTGLFCFAVWFYGRREPAYLWFSIASIGSAVYCANQFVHYLWISADAWRWITNMGTDLWACAIVFVILRSLHIHRPKLEKICLVYLGTGVPVYFYASFFQAFDINIYFHLGSLCLMVYIVGLCAKHYLVNRDPLSATYGTMITIGALAGLHDTIMQAIVNVGWQGSGFEYRINMLQFIAPTGFLLIGVTLIRQYIHALTQADRLNAQLEDRVAEAKAELEENYQMMQEVLVKQSQSEERERIYRDLHDDVGSKLLSLYYRLDDESNSTLAKSALEDLRDIVSRKSMTTGSLTSAVQHWQVEAFSRCRDAGVELEWNYQPSTCDPSLDQSQQAQLRRMLREVFSNAILHSKPTSILVEIQTSEHQLNIAVSNDGTEESCKHWQPGRGISNLKLRARELGGTLHIDDKADNWVQVSWQIPLAKVGAKNA